MQPLMLKGVMVQECDDGDAGVVMAMGEEGANSGLGESGFNSRYCDTQNSLTYGVI